MKHLWLRLILSVAALIALVSLAVYLFRLYGPAAILAPLAGAGAVVGAAAKAVGTRKVEKPENRPRRPSGAVVVEAPAKEGEPERPKRPRRGGLS